MDMTGFTAYFLPWTYVILVPAAIVLLEPEDIPGWDTVRFFISSGLFLCGFSVCVMAALEMRKHNAKKKINNFPGILHTRLRPGKCLVKSGVYSYLRNPEILGILLMFSGESLYFLSIALCTYSIFAGVLLVFCTIHVEEKRLKELFGREFEEYREKVPMLIPLMRPPKNL